MGHSQSQLNQTSFADQIRSATALGNGSFFDPQAGTEMQQHCNYSFGRKHGDHCSKLPQWIVSTCMLLWKWLLSEEDINAAYKEAFWWICWNLFCLLVFSFNIGFFWNDLGLSLLHRKPGSFILVMWEEGGGNELHGWTFWNCCGFTACKAQWRQAMQCTHTCVTMMRAGFL